MAILMQIKMHTSIGDVDALRHDLQNGIQYTYHQQCKSSFCKHTTDTRKVIMYTKSVMFNTSNKIIHFHTKLTEGNGYVAICYHSVCMWAIAKLSLGEYMHAHSHICVVLKQLKTATGEFSRVVFSKKKQEEWKSLMVSVVAEALSTQSLKEQPQNQSKLANKTSKQKYQLGVIGGRLPHMAILQCAK